MGVGAGGVALGVADGTSVGARVEVGGIGVALGTRVGVEEGAAVGVALGAAVETAVASGAHAVMMKASSRRMKRHRNAVRRRRVETLISTGNRSGSILTQINHP